MVRDALRERLIEALRQTGGSAGNGRLLTELGWQEHTYLSVRNELVDQGVVALGRGRAAGRELEAAA